MLTVDIIRSQVLRNSSYYFDVNSVGTIIFYLTFSFLEMSGAQFMTSAERLARFMKLRRILKFSDKFSQHQQCTQSLALPEIFLTFSSKISTCTSWMVSEFNFWHDSLTLPTASWTSSTAGWPAPSFSLRFNGVRSKALRQGSKNRSRFLGWKDRSSRYVDGQRQLDQLQPPATGCMLLLSTARERGCWWALS